MHSISICSANFRLKLLNRFLSKKEMIQIFSIVILVFINTDSQCQSIKILFDASKAQAAGNADWVIDANSRNLGFSSGPAILNGGNESNAQITPSPAQSGITVSTAETFWSGALSYWAIDCVNRNYIVESLPYNGQITYGNSGNSQDLSNYNVFVVCEPNILFTAAQKTAILNFVQNGGGLFMVADHTISDRNNDGEDSPFIWNDLMTNNSVQSNPFGMSFDLADFSQTTSNIPNLPNDSILHGPAGNVTQVQFAGGTSLTLSPAQNPTVKGVVYKTGSAFGNSNVMCAYARFGNGKVAVIGDSSPCDDGTGDPNDGLFDGYIQDAGGNHRKLIMNMTIWLTTQNSTTPPIADFSGSPLTVCSGQSTTFSDNSTSGNTSYFWNFGSGATPATASTAGPHVVTYTTAGNKTISLSVTNPSGTNSITKSNYITVNGNCSTSDIGVISLLTPTTNNCPTPNSEISVRIQNFSLTALNFATTPVTIDLQATDPALAVLPFNHTISSGSLSAGSTLDVTITPTYSMMLSGNYLFNATTVLSGDINPANDAIPATTILVNSGSQSEIVLLNESMGTVTSTTSILSHETNNGFDNDNLSMSGTADVRITTSSNGYSSASGGANVFFTASGRNFILSGINTTANINTELSFGVLKSVASSDGSDLLIQVSTDGTNYSDLTMPALPLNSSWNYTTLTGTIPSSQNLSIKFTTTSATQYRIDDILLVDHVAQAEICGNSLDDNCNGLVDENCSVTLNLNVLIEGFYQSNGKLAAAIDSVVSPFMCDSITIELHSAANPYSTVYIDKKTIDRFGNGVFTFPSNLLGQTLYIVVRHRNSIQTWSSLPVLFNNLSIAYSFSDNTTKAFGNNLKNLGNGYFAIYSGDVDQNGVVDTSDFSIVENNMQQFLTGYLPSDVTGNKITESSDGSVVENNYGKMISKP
jgi:PKD repeat protein